ncbi:MAG: hypothetical protein J4F97_03670 [Pseudomonadales bacterium]|nr:hypothetical protein [Pseudomonadales bacterium]
MELPGTPSARPSPARERDRQPVSELIVRILFSLAADGRNELGALRSLEVRTSYMYTALL